MQGRYRQREVGGRLLGDSAVRRTSGKTWTNKEHLLSSRRRCRASVSAALLRLRQVSTLLDVWLLPKPIFGAELKLKAFFK